MRGAALWGAVAKAYVTFGGVSTTEAIPLLVIDSPYLGDSRKEAFSGKAMMDFLRRKGIDGILGIGPKGYVAHQAPHAQYWAVDAHGRVQELDGVESGQQLVGLHTALPLQAGMTRASILTLYAPRSSKGSNMTADGMLRFGADTGQLEQDHAGGHFKQFARDDEPGNAMKFVLPHQRGQTQAPWVGDTGIAWEPLVDHTLVIVAPGTLARYGSFLVQENCI